MSQTRRQELFIMVFSPHPLTSPVWEAGNLLGSWNLNFSTPISVKSSWLIWPLFMYTRTNVNLPSRRMERERSWLPDERGDGERERRQRKRKQLLSPKRLYLPESPCPSQTESPTGNKVLKHMGLWRAFHIQTTHWQFQTLIFYSSLILDFKLLMPGI